MYVSFISIVKYRFYLIR